MTRINQFVISVMSPPVQGRVSSVTGTTVLHEGAEGTALEISNYFDELVDKKKVETFSFTWKPETNYIATFVNIRSPKKKPKKTFQLVLIGKLFEEGKLIWSRQLDLKGAWVKDAGRAPSGGQLVNIDYESATPSKEVHH